MAPAASVVMCSKSTWSPAIRREHAFATQAAVNGLDVTFIERPADVRAARAAPWSWLGALAGATSTAHHGDVPPRVAVVRRSTPVPGHRGCLAAVSDQKLLIRRLRVVSSPSTTLVGYLPWQWPALTAVDVGRRVFDCTDDWSALFPERAPQIRQQLVRIGDEADAVLVTSPLLAPLFGGRDVVVVRNAGDLATAAGAPVAPLGQQRMIYVGTLSERFDVALVTKVLDLLPGWRLDLYGPCQYAGAGDRPGPELATLLAARPQVVRWHGLVSRADLPGVLDSADVLLLPNNPEVARGQSSMKLYDYAARGRPVVSTEVEIDPTQTPPGVWEARTPERFAAAVTSASAHDITASQAQVDWFTGNTWATRWPAWSQAVFGDGTPTAGAARVMTS